MKKDKKKYKIKITRDRILGPLDLDRVEALIKKGRLGGEEPTAVEPYGDWSPLISFPELGELLLKKLEQDRIAPNTPKIPDPTNSPTKTIVDSDRTKTIAMNLDREDQTSFGIPTLVDLPALKEDLNPDLEKTKVDISLLPPPQIQETEGGTKILSIDAMNSALQAYVPPEAKSAASDLVEKKNIFGKKIDATQYVTETGKRRLLSRNTAALLALGLLAIAYFTNQQQEEADPTNIGPRYHTFPYIEVNVPPRLGDKIDRMTSGELLEAGEKITEKETPSAYIIAIKNYFYPSVGKNITSWDSKALLASAYLRISELIPRDQRLFDTLDKLLFPGPQRNQWTPEYAVALAEYYQLLNRYDQAQEVVDFFLARRQTPELLYQKAKIAFERREIDLALNTISKSIPPENVQRANPRHLLFYAICLDQRGQKDAAIESLNRLKREGFKYGLHGPSLVFHADFLLRNGKNKEALEIIKIVADRPYLLDRMQLAEAFMVAAKALESVKSYGKANQFAEAAYAIHHNKEDVEDLLFRIKSRLPNSKDAYSLIVAGKQKEKAKQNDQAMSLYVKALELNRSDPIPFLLMARLYEQKGDVEEAIDRYGKAVSGTSSRPLDSYINRARIYANRFELEKAKNMIQMASDLRQQRDKVEYLKGLVNIKSKRDDLARPYLENALEKGSRFTDLYVQMGDMEVEKKNQKLAEFYFSMALRYERFHPKAMLGVALARFHLDSPSRAISFLKDRLASQPNSAAIMTNLAIIYLRSGDQDAGKNYLQNAIRSDSRYAEAFRLLGDLTKDEGNRQSDNIVARKNSYRYALASYEMYSKLAPYDPEGYKSTGDLYFDIRDLGAAAKNYYKVLSLTKNYPDVNLRLAQIARNGGDIEKAMSLLEEEIRVNPRSDAARVEKGSIFMLKNDMGAATKAFTEAARINEKNSDALFGLGKVYQSQGSYDNALSLYTRVLKLDPLKAEVYWQMGAIYQKQNNRPKAIQSFTNFKGIVKDPAGQAEADKRIAELQQ